MGRATLTTLDLKSTFSVIAELKEFKGVVTDKNWGMYYFAFKIK